MDRSNSKRYAWSLQMFRRLPSYYNYLKALHASRMEHVAASAIAREMCLNEVQVRKDLAAVSRSPGKPRMGFVVEELLESIGECLGYNSRKDAILVGAGHLGKAMLGYRGFEEYGVRIVAAFDNNAKLVGKTVAGKKIFDVSMLSSLCEQKNIHIGIITVPAEHAQAVCDALVKGGISAIWNFAPVHLRVPDHILVQNENMAASLALLSRHLTEM